MTDRRVRERERWGGGGENKGGRVSVIYMDSAEKGRKTEIKTGRSVYHNLCTECSPLMS